MRLNDFVAIGRSLAGNRTGHPVEDGSAAAHRRFWGLMLRLVRWLRTRATLRSGLTKARLGAAADRPIKQVNNLKYFIDF